jgi:hypothetical protein
MENKDLSFSFAVEQSPEEVFAAINNPRAWWSPIIEGFTDQLNSVFYYHYIDLHRTTFKITEFVPNQKVVWHALDSYVSFVKDKYEWNGTDVVFEIAAIDGKTQVKFTHVGLKPSVECYELCNQAWTTYITKSLKDLITTGKGSPTTVEDVAAKARVITDNMEQVS